MGQIVKGKKKGRPSKADLALRASNGGDEGPPASRRQSLRRRNVRYDSFIDYDEYLNDFEEDEEEERRKEKKMKLVLKLHNQNNNSNNTARANHAREDVSASSSSSEEEGDSERKRSKKRRISGESEAEDGSENDDEEERVRKAEYKEQESAPGTPSHHPNGLTLPDKKMLELILDKLQKKDTYGVYAEPVDLEELPDYLDVIDHPMDFATVRKKLGNGSYSTLEQFERDVFLICSNAMKYNAPETIYHKQARTIQELAKKKFEKLRIGIERSERELKSEQKSEIKSEPKSKLSFLGKKQMKKPLSRNVPEAVGSDYSSGATLATAGEVQNGIQAGGRDKPTSNIDGLVEGTFSMVDNNQDKTEDLSSGKGLLSKFGRKPSMLDENRRATYNISNQPVVRSESIFTTFESEIKQLIPVGLDAQYSYSRSLARFAATLGPIAWKVASHRIEQSLPPGCKFGRGWVGEYEPLPTPVLMLEKQTRKESISFTKFPCTTESQNGDITSRATKGGNIDVTLKATDAQKGDGTSWVPVPDKEHPVKGSTLEANQSLFHPASGPMLDGKSSSTSSAVTKTRTPVNPTYQPHNLPPRSFSDSQNKASKQVELNLPPSSYHDADVVTEKHLPNNTVISASKPRELSKTVGTTHSVPAKLRENNGVGSRGLPNGKIVNNRMISSSSDGVPNHMARAASYHPQGREHHFTDPAEAMKISAVKAYELQKPSNQSSASTPPVTSSVPSVTKESNNAAVAAARAWMSMGAGGFRPPAENSTSPKNHISVESLYNPTRQLHPQFPRVQGQFQIPAGMQLHPEKSHFPFQAFVRPGHAGNEGQFQSRPVIFPQFVATDFSRFQMQSPWQGLNPHSQAKQKQETPPPDLNIVFQSPGSPAKQSSGVMVDSPQPDLALQL